MMTAKGGVGAILILGEHDKGLGVPFSPKTLSGRRLRAMMAEAGLDAAGLGNVFEYRDGETVARDLRAVCAGYAVIVALGKVAADECERQGVVHRRLPHPAVRKRTMLEALQLGLCSLRGAHQSQEVA